MSAELAEFLLARIAEDEQAAQAASFLRPAGPDPAFVSLTDGLRRMQQRFDSPRVLAECDAKRRIVEGFRYVAGEDADHAWAVLHGDNAQQVAIATLRLLALPYADHPDYDPAWRP